MTDAKVIAEGLSEAMHNCLVMQMNGHFTDATCRALMRRGLARDYRTLTPLGLEVRAYLIGETL